MTTENETVLEFFHDLGRWDHLPVWLQLSTKFVPETCCWLWTKDLSRTGHPRVRFDGRRTAAHRFVFQFLRGPISRSLVLDHLCRNRACVNPWHLEPVTAHENTRRGVGPTAVNAQKTHCKRGHDLSDATNVYRGMKRRECRACRRVRAKERRT